MSTKTVDSGPETFFAPAGRDADGELQRKEQIVRAAPSLQKTIDALPEIVIILNEQRQIVGANQAFYRLHDPMRETLIGKRIGEAVSCINCMTGPDGCGTSKNCATCGAVNAILESQASLEQVVRECRILTDVINDSPALDLKVTASAIEFGGKKFTLCTIVDNAATKRLAVLTRAFFHDVLNTVGGIQGFAELLEEEKPGDERFGEDVAQLVGMVDQLVEEIQSQRDLVCAESGDLTPDPKPLRTAAVLENLKRTYAKHAVAIGRDIVLDNVWNGTVVTDERLITRVLGNMLKNALEATEPGDAVQISCENLGDKAAFRVHNRSVMPEDVQSQIFQRSFSTKADAGRGIGTYSMKLLGERYLGGRVTFVSNEPTGTTFTLELSL